jgi:hypothetical protein
LTSSNAFVTKPSTQTETARTDIELSDAGAPLELVSGKLRALHKSNVVVAGPVRCSSCDATVRCGADWILGGAVAEAGEAPLACKTTCEFDVGWKLQIAVRDRERRSVEVVRGGAGACEGEGEL